MVLTPCDADGVPCLVRFMYFFTESQVLFVNWFDGSDSLLTPDELGISPPWTTFDTQPMEWDDKWYSLAQSILESNYAGFRQTMSTLRFRAAWIRVDAEELRPSKHVADIAG